MDSLFASTSLFITKSSYSDGMMRWAAVNSDTEWDLHDEKMSMALYQKMLGYIREKKAPPAAFKSMVCSEYWCGGMPYISIAHYPDANGKAVPGQPTELFIDGTQLKAKGILFDNPLGQAVWKSLKRDETLGENEDKIRISIAFLDLAHKHGDVGKTFVRNSLTDVCAECQEGKGNKIYLDGYLVHLALTRVPVNPRTIMTVEDIMAKKSISTRKEDAVSILGDAELADEVAKSALETKSDILVEMSQNDNALAEGEKMVKDGEAANDQAMVDKGKEMIAACKAEPKGSLVADAKTKPVADETETAGDPEEDDTTIDTKKGKKKCSLTEDDVEVIRSLVSEIVTKSATVSIPEKSALDLATDELYNSVKSAIGLQGVTVEQRLESINPSLSNLGTAITAMVRESVGVDVVTPVSAEQTMVLEAVTSLTNMVKDLSQELSMLKEKSLVPSNVVQNRVPVQRSIQPQLVTQSRAAANPNSITNIVRRSVSEDLPLV